MTMDLLEIKRRIQRTEESLNRIRSLTFPYRGFYEEEKEWKKDPRIDKNLQKEAKRLRESLPPEFSLSHSYLERHFAWNEVKDWADIYLSDTPAELEALNKYKEKINALDAVQDLHPKVSKFLDHVFRGKLDTALALSFRSIEIRLRSELKGILDVKSARDLVKKSFGRDVLRYKGDADPDAVRDFLAGVIGVERNFFIHKKLQTEGIPSSEVLRFCLRKMTIASEAHSLLDRCEVRREKEWFSLAKKDKP